MFIFFLFPILSSTTIIGQNIDEVDQYAHYISDRYGIPGMAIGIINKGEIVHRGFYGTYDLENNMKIDEESLFNLHSLSKVFVNTAIFKLIEQGEIKLKDELRKHIADFPKHWESVQIKHLLSHSSGMPNIIKYFKDDLSTTKENLYSASPIFKPGEYFDYNQTNYWMLNRIIDKLCIDGFDNTIRKQVEGSTTHPLIFDYELIDSTSQPKEYRPGSNSSLKMEYSQVQDYMNGAAGINITLDDFLKWNIRLDNNELINESSKMDMWQPFEFENNHPFTNGWGIYQSNGTSSVGFSGGGVAGLRKFTKEDLSIIVLTNGYQYRFDVNTFINWIAGNVRPEMLDELAIVNDNLYKVFSKLEQKKALSKFASIKNEMTNLNLDHTLNSIGYELLAKQLNEKALTVFELNTIEYPESWNAWDSLAEAYEILGEPIKAIQFYRESIKLNPNNEHATERLRVLIK